MNKQIDEVLDKFLTGEASRSDVYEVIKAFAKGQDPGKQMFTIEEILGATGDTAETATGAGVMDDGITPYKAVVKDGKLVEPVFDPEAWAQNAPGTKLPHYVFHHRCRWYRVAEDGVSLTDKPEPEEEEELVDGHKPWKGQGPDTRRYPSRAGKKDFPNGRYLTDYDDLGYHIRSRRADWQPPKEGEGNER